MCLLSAYSLLVVCLLSAYHLLTVCLLFAYHVLTVCLFSAYCLLTLPTDCLLCPYCLPIICLMSAYCLLTLPIDCLLPVACLHVCNATYGTSPAAMDLSAAEQARVLCMLPCTCKGIIKALDFEFGLVRKQYLDAPLIPSSGQSSQSDLSRTCSHLCTQHMH